jgi:hypothetical protein
MIPSNATFIRGADTFTTIRRLDDFVPKSNPLRSIRAMAN